MEVEKTLPDPEQLLSEKKLELEEIVPEPEQLVPCANCGRTFAISSVERHYGICVRTHQSLHHRGKFDSSRQRIQGTELEIYLPPPVSSGVLDTAVGNSRVVCVAAEISDQTQEQIRSWKSQRRSQRLGRLSGVIIA